MQTSSCSVFDFDVFYGINAIVVSAMSSNRTRPACRIAEEAIQSHGLL